jgi:hypothetical protein
MQMKMKRGNRSLKSTDILTGMMQTKTAARGAQIPGIVSIVSLEIAS